MTRFIVLGLVSLGLVAGCTDEVDVFDFLATAPTSVPLGADTVTVELQAVLGAGADEVDQGPSLVMTTLPAEASLVVERAWVVRGEAVANGVPYRGSPYDSGPGSNAWTVPGDAEWPAWTAGEEVYVVAQFRRTSGGGTFLVRSLPLVIPDGL